VKENLYTNCNNINYFQKVKILIILSFVINSCILFAQRTLLLERTVVNYASTGTWSGVNIPRDVPTTFTYRNNSITSINSDGYMLQAGDESPGITNNNLAGEVITGNKFTWNGTDMKSITHGVFTGYNINAIIKYNYLDKVPMSIIRKSNGMTNTSGGVAYNIVNNPPATAVVVKGMNNVMVYNNTFYSARTPSETWRGLIDIYTNTDIIPNGSATGTKIFNNIFYTKHQIANINLYGNENLTGFESDYNVYYCEDGAPIFKVAGITKTFAQWQAMGYDIHSVVINPNFINFTAFVPNVRLDYGTNLGSSWQTGLSVNAVWGTTDPATENQNGKWQVGARVLTEGAPSDLTAPTISDFTIPATATSLTIPITNFTAIDNTAVTGYLLTETSSIPNAGSNFWTSSSPTTYTFLSPGSKILYAWAKDVAGNVSKSVSRTVVITSGNVTENKAKIYPNPAHDFFYVSIEDSILSPLTLKIIDLSGKIVFTKPLGQAINQVQIPKNLTTSLYVITLESKHFLRQSQQLVINQ